MGDAEIKVAKWRFVELGRVVLLEKGPYAGGLATIVEIIDHKRALIDGPGKIDVPRQAVSLSNVVLTPIVIEKVPRGARRGAVKKLWESSKVEEKWESSAWAKKRAQKEKRRGLSDFDKFKVLRLRKQARFEIRKSVAKVKASAK